MNKEGLDQPEESTIEEQIQQQREELTKIQKEYDMEIIVEPLQIMMQTNVPSKPSFDFTSNLIYIPENAPPIKRERLDKYPYLCKNYKYPATVLMSLSYNAIVEFFFNSDKMISIMNSSKVQNFKMEDQTEVEKYNIQFMMKSLFPTKFLIPINSHQSIDHVLKNDTFPHNFFFNPNQIRYSYMNFGNETYTLSRVTWVNDLLNHKHFNTLMKKTYFANKVLRKTGTEANIVELQKQEMKETINKANTGIKEKEQELEREYNESIEVVKSGLQEYKKAIFAEEASSEEEEEEEQDDDNNDDDNNDDDNNDDDSYAPSEEPVTRSGRTSRRPTRYIGGNDDYSAENLTKQVEELSKELIKEIVDTGVEFEEQSILFVRDMLGIDLNNYFKQNTTQLRRTKKELDEIRNKLSESIKENFQNVTDGIQQLNDEIDVLKKDLKTKKANLQQVQPFVENPYEKLEPPINVHNIYLRNKLKTNMSGNIRSQNITNFYDKILPLFIRARDRKDNELTSGNKYFKSLLYGGIDKDGIQGKEIHDNIQKFYNKMNGLYKKYITGDTSVKINRERDLLYTGVDQLHFKYPKPGVPMRRVFFTIELIEGEVNDENRDAITCPYSGEYLGALFEKIFYGGDMFGWKLKPAEFLYSVKTETVDRTKTDFNEEKRERDDAREEAMQFRQEAEQPLFELKEFTKLLQPDKKNEGETIKYDQNKFDEFFEKIINDDLIQSLFEDADKYDIRHPINKKLYITDHEPSLQLNVRTRLIKKIGTDGLLQELSKYYDTDSRNINLKNNWQQHKQTLLTVHDQLSTKTDDPEMNDEDRSDVDKQIHIAKYLLAIMNHAEDIIDQFFRNTM